MSKTSIDTMTVATPMTSYTTLVRWTLSQIGAFMPLIVVIQAVLAAGMIIGFGLLVPSIDDATILFLSTGAPTVMLLLIGLVIVPQGVATARNNGTFHYLRTLPAPRWLHFFADLTVWILVAAPSLVVAVLVARWHYDVAFTIDVPVLVAGTLLVTVTGTSVGYAIAVMFPPMISQVLTQVLAFFVMLFSPINYPASQLPQWFQTVHDYLPFESGAALIRAGLASAQFDWEWSDLATLAAWAIVGVVISLRALVRRR